MSTGHLAPVAASAVVGSKTAFSFGRVGDGKQSGGKESTSIHGNTSRRPGNKAAETVQRNRGKNLSGQSPALANIDVQTGSLCRASDTKKVHLRVIKGYFDDSRSDGEAWTVAGYVALSDI